MAPTRRGFGSTVLDSLVQMSVFGTAEMIFASDGLSWELSCPIDKAVDPAKSEIVQRHSIEG